MKYRYGLIVALIALALAVTLAPASAKTQSISHGGTYFGNVLVDADQIVDGDITVFGGDAIIEGRVNGDVTDFGGAIDARPGSVITGEQHDFGSGMTAWMPWVPGTSSAIARENERLMVRLAYSVIVVLAFLIFPVRVRTALDRIEHHPGLSAAVGVLALVAVVPIAVLLFISLVGWPLIPVEFIAIFAGILIGQAALGVLIGRRLYELIKPHGTPSPLGALILGLIVISAAEIVPIVGGLVTGLVCLVGLGAAILAFVRETTFMGAGAGPGSAAGPRPPISGPPMTAA
jgi:hypothetical protein